MTPFGVALRNLREDRGLNQKDLARRLGISAKLLSAIENGQAGSRRIGDLADLAILLGLSDQELLKLRRAQELSSYQLQIPRDATPQMIRVANHFIRVLGILSHSEIREVEALLDRSAASQPESRDNTEGGMTMKC